VPDVTADYLALRQDVGAVRLERDVIRAHGKDAVAYLQGQLSQDMAGVAEGRSTRAFLLEPQGKVVAWLRVTRVAETELVLDVDAGFAEPTLERLERFKIRTDCTFEAVDWACVAVRGPKADTARPDTGDAVDVDWPGLPGFDLLGPGVRVPDGVRECGPEAYDAVRIEAGVPAMGAEITEATIPHEAGRWVVDASVSFTKGCYTGQELVYRIDSRGGNVPRRLRGIVVATNVLPPVGARVMAGGKEVGTLTSVGESLERRAPVALALVHRSVEPPADVELAWPGADGVPARVEDLPLVD
jgi:folate-binding protein YgfZ